MARSTLLTSPLSQLDFVARLAFFSLAPLAIVPAATLFPVVGALLSVAAALVVIVAGESARRWARKSKLVRLLVTRELAMLEYYEKHPPKRFAYYLFYPLLFPYWLLKRDARREFWFYKGYTLTSAGILLASSCLQFFLYYPPELGLREFVPVILISLAVETFLVLALLMPIATSVVWLHRTFRRKRLYVLLAAGLLSTTLSLSSVVSRRDPVVSWASRRRAVDRTETAPERARQAHRKAIHAAWDKLRERPGSIDRDGKVQGEPLELARGSLDAFYRGDESEAFDLWATPAQQSPQWLVLYFQPSDRRLSLIWLACKDGVEVTDRAQLPPSAFGGMRRAARD